MEGEKRGRKSRVREVGEGRGKEVLGRENYLVVLCF